jgi:hypothetical protein
MRVIFSQGFHAGTTTDVIKKFFEEFEPVGLFIGCYNVLFILIIPFSINFFHLYFEYIHKFYMCVCLCMLYVYIMCMLYILYICIYMPAPIHRHPCS